MSDTNAFISNGTCYTAQGKRLDNRFIPCGNDAFGHQTCCGAGDNCLADGACFGVHGSGYGSYLTYWGGCTDPDYEAATCPKKVIDQPWVALTLCDNSDGEWAICSQDGNPSTLQAGSYCSCTDAASATVAFSDSNTLTSICSLPKSTGESIQFFVGHFPSSSLTSGSAAPAQSSASTTPSAGDSSSAASSSATPTSGQTSSEATTAEASSSSVTVLTSSGQTFTTSTGPSTTSPVSTVGSSSGSTSTHSGLSSTAKIAIGVGAGVGVLILLAIILASFFYRRKHRRTTPTKVESGVHDNDDTKLFKAHPYSSFQPPMSAMSNAPPLYDTTGQKIHEADGQIIQEADGRAAAPGTLRSELEGSRVPRKGETGPVAELPGSENFAGEQGATNTLTQDVPPQLRPGWRPEPLRPLNSAERRGVHTRF